MNILSKTKQLNQNGKIKLTVNYKNGQKDGIQKVYYDNGQLGSMVKYVNGRREEILLHNINHFLLCVKIKKFIYF